MQDVRTISIEAFDYDLPDGRIAHHPTTDRSASKLLHYAGGVISDHIFSELPARLPEKTFLVFNETRVLPVRLFFHKPTGGALEVFLLEPAEAGAVEQTLAADGSCRWNCLVRGLKKWKSGPLVLEVSVDGASIQVQAVLHQRREEDVQIDFSWPGGAAWSDVIEAAGKIPLPPYIQRETTAEDAERYQPVFSKVQGSVAAPTASLHFDQTVLDGLTERGIQHTEVVLHVGAGTFKPVSSDRIGDHAMHREYLEVSLERLEVLYGALDRTVVPVGTTALRTIESLYWLGMMALEGTLEVDLPHLDQWYPYGVKHPVEAPTAIQALIDHLKQTGRSHLRAYTGLLIAPGYTLRVAKGLITNFHQPKSTLLLLVAALIGDDWKRVYDHGLDNDYRFLSYGDGSLLIP